MKNFNIDKLTCRFYEKDLEQEFLSYRWTKTWKNIKVLLYIDILIGMVVRFDDIFIQGAGKAPYYLFYHFFAITLILIFIFTSNENKKRYHQYFFFDTINWIYELWGNNLLLIRGCFSCRRWCSTFIMYAIFNCLPLPLH